MCVKSQCAVILLVVNVLFSGKILYNVGWGTMISAFMDTKFNTTQFLVGLVQFLLVWTIIMWIASIVWGVLIYNKSKD